MWNRDKLERNLTASKRNFVRFLDFQIKMERFLFVFLALASLLALSQATPAGGEDAIVEIIKQKLVKFPDDVDQQQQQQQRDQTQDQQKTDEAKRILEEIEKINQSLGYVKKQTEPPKVPPILDSSQYLFPKPAYQPFHAQSHQVSGSNGEILLVPSIRAMKFDRSSKQKAAALAKLINYNVPPQRKSTTKTSIQQLPPSKQKTHTRTQTRIPSQSQSQSQFYYRPNQVHIPAPQGEAEAQQLPTHFVIPVRLYKLNKEEYLQKFAPQEYRVKGYKIVGDIDNFYGKAKAPAKHKSSHSKKSTPKYHLFFLPREMALNEDSTFQLKQPARVPTLSNAANNDNKLQDMGSREEKLTNRPFKVQTTATSTANGNLANTTSSTQIIRKRIVPKPLRNKETNINSLATQQLSDGSSATTATTIHITPPPPPPQQPSQASIPPSANSNNILVNVPPTSANSNKNSYSLLGNRPLLNAFGNTNNRFGNSNIPNMNFNANLNVTGNNATAANAIKNAFQNFFKFPFRQPETKPELSNGEVGGGVNLESVPLQIPQKTFFAAQPLLPQPFYHSEQPPTPIPQQSASNDYKWEDDSSNSAADEEDESQEEVEKKIFGHRHQQQQETQKEAIKQGGIIIQRLKVRKGGIAIAGPGGVATAGSGGTAIVGPGGYALTHPRSLTIAGPGAKVIAIPADVDLKDALQRTNLDEQSFPREGKIVATGPTVYYSPATGTTADEV